SFLLETNFTGTATIDYTITDGIGGTNSSTITVLVTNIPPTVNADTYTVNENSTNTLTPLDNDSPNTPGGVLTIISVSTTNGTVDFSSQTNVVFTPATNFVGTLTMDYTVSDGIGGTNSSTITVTVTNVPPVANPDSYTVSENTTNTLTPLSNDTVGTPGGSLTITNVIPTNGIATIIGGTNVSFTPTNNFIGVTHIGYTIIDNVGGSSSSVITVTVTNVPPVANPDSYTVSENTTNTLTPLSNDTVGTPGGSLTITNVIPTNGIATIIGGTNV